MTMGPHSPSRRASCSRLYGSLVIFCNHFSAEALLAFDVAPADASLHIELSKEEPNQYSTLPYPTLQTRDAFLATDALINARKNGFRSLAVASTRLPLGADRLWSQYDRAEDVQSWALRAQRWMDKIVVINGTDRNPSSCVLVTTQPTHLKLPPLVDARDINFSLNWANLIAHRAAHECSHLRAVLLKGRPMESSHTSRGEAGVGISNTEQGRSAVHSRVLKGLVQSMGPSRFEDMAGTARSFRWTGGGQVARALTTNEIQKNAYIEDILRMAAFKTKQYGALAQRYPHFGSLDGAVTTATPLEIGSLICFGLKRGMHSLSCDQTAYGEETLSIGIVRYIYSKVTTNHCNRDTLPSLVLLSNVVVIESLGPPATTYRSTTDLTSCYPDERIITCAIARQGLEMMISLSHNQHPITLYAGSQRLIETRLTRWLGLKSRASRALVSLPSSSIFHPRSCVRTQPLESGSTHQQSKEGLFDAWSHARHQPKRRGPQATFDRPPRVRKRSERVFEDF
ncbi:BZ3500_MvSof-1268-A1-R1_Chr12-2g03775 [Microbotryum saponariae]|uniref:BZ3500_MvSof-1268-A1-R1_Chr12-2g03775 protein n=1 Tax=Microbotryum saponariae TaxID=289078 RepID=A0A2X0MJ46_9BASI|nr:BZ3500_MvSof-1268-A1-R1_Chr12-2g03775 [Microbotryum saponariae]